MATHTLPSPDGRRGVTVPSRRDLLGAAGFTALAGIAGAAIAKSDTSAAMALPAPRDDAAMLALCDRFLHLQKQVDATYDREKALYDAMEASGASVKELQQLEKRGDVERTPCFHEQRALLADLSEMSAVTPDGQRARARVLMAWYDMHKGDVACVSIDGTDIMPLFRDLLGGTV